MPKTTKKCPKCQSPMLFMFGCGWDYDRYVCSDRGCDHAEETERSSYPPEVKR